MLAGINYIIKLMAGLSGATVKTETSNHTVTFGEGESALTYQTAHEDEKVTVSNFTLAENKELGGIYYRDDEDENNQVKAADDAWGRNDDGSFWVRMLRGGGMMLGLILKDKTVQPEPEPEKKTEEKKPEEQKPEVKKEEAKETENAKTEESPAVEVDPKSTATSAFDAFCNELVWKIRNAPQNGTVEADAGDFPGLMQKVFTALNDRPDVSLKLKTRDGEITIPAGAGLLEKVSRGVVTWAEIRGLV